MGGRIDRQADRQKDRQIDRKTDRQRQTDGKLLKWGKFLLKIDRQMYAEERATSNKYLEVYKTRY